MRKAVSKFALTARVVLAMALTFFCGSQDANSFKDSRDGKIYKKVVIGSQTWMAENLNYEAEGSKCYDDDPNNCAIWGRLYDWETAKKACPAGWHLPSDEEWRTLIDFVGGSDIAGKKLKSAAGWNENGNGTNDYGWSALPGGLGFPDGNFVNTGVFGYWWSATGFDAYSAGGRVMGHDMEIVNWDGYDKTYLFSVRCVQDGSGSTETATAQAAEITAMPSQNFVGLWGDEPEYSYIKIWNIFADDVDFNWYIVRRVNARGTARVDGNRIAFVAISGGDHTEDDDDARISGTMEFSVNGITLAVEESNHPMINAGATYHYPVKASDGDLSLPPVIDLYQYQNEYSPSESNYRFWGWSKNGRMAYTSDFFDGGEKYTYARIFNFVGNGGIWSKQSTWDNWNGSGDDEGLPPDEGFYQEFRNACIENGIEFVQAEYRQLPIVHNNKTYKVVLEIAQKELNDDFFNGVVAVDNYRIFVDMDGKRKVVHEAEAQDYTYNIFPLGYFISPFENKALLVMGTHIIGGHVFTSFVGCDLEGGFDTAATKADDDGPDLAAWNAMQDAIEAEQFVWDDDPMITKNGDQIWLLNGHSNNNNISATWNRGTLTISGSGAIEGNYNDGKYPWTEEEEKPLLEIFKVIINDGITEIGDRAFRRKQLESVTIPRSVTRIGEFAFYDNNLTSVIIPNSVTFIGEAAFFDNPIVSITIGANVELEVEYERTSAFSGNFEEVYNKNGKQAGTYTSYDGGKTWAVGKKH